MTAFDMLPDNALSLVGQMAGRNQRAYSNLRCTICLLANNLERTSKTLLFDLTVVEYNRDHRHQYFRPFSLEKDTSTTQHLTPTDHLISYLSPRRSHGHCSSQSTECVH